MDAAAVLSGGVIEVIEVAAQGPQGPPGTPAIAEGLWGIDEDGDPYFDPEGLEPGSPAALVLDGDGDPALLPLGDDAP